MVEGSSVEIHTQNYDDPVALLEYQFTIFSKKNQFINFKRFVAYKSITFLSIS